jgi:(2Fe-2S) ferredoxin
MSDRPDRGKFERHVFVCLNERPDGHPRGCCAAKDAHLLHQRLKELVAARGLAGRIRINKAGCLDVCEHGASVVVYPEAVWYGGVTPADAEELVDRHLIAGQPVERLRLGGEELHPDSA